VYALLSGLNAAVVGIIALAAVQLAEKAITDRITRILVFLGATAGLLYNALWYFPLLMFLAGCAAVIFDFRVLHGPVKRVAQLWRRDRTVGGGEEGVEIEIMHMSQSQGQGQVTGLKRSFQHQHLSIATWHPKELLFPTFQ
jgi:chromate transport protein ChrA